MRPKIITTSIFTLNVFLNLTKNYIFFLFFSHKEVMSDRHQSCEARGDEVFSGTDTSRWSTSSSSSYTSEGQDRACSLINKIAQYQSSDGWQETKLPLLIEGILLLCHKFVYCLVGIQAAASDGTFSKSSGYILHIYLVKSP